MPDSEATTGRSDHPGLLVVLFTVLGLGVFSVLAIVVRRPARDQLAILPRKTQGPDYVGSRVCADCHATEYASHLVSGHASTFRPAASHPLARWLDGQTIDDPQIQGVTWRYALRQGSLVAERTDGETSEHWILDFALGSGEHATTFLSLTDLSDPRHPTSHEHRLTHYTHTHSMDLTPGQSGTQPTSGLTIRGRDLSPSLTLKCIGCHVTRTSAEGPQSLDVATLLPNVGCEACHGPGGTHIERARAGARPFELTLPFGPGRWKPEALAGLCGRCHRTLADAPPGSVRPDTPELVRFQVIGMMQSACYRGSRGVLHCLSCHEPHSKPSREEGSYESICLDCHRASSQRACPVDDRQGCVRCHMPKRDAGHGMAFADHWIRRPDPGQSPP